MMKAKLAFVSAVAVTSVVGFGALGTATAALVSVPAPPAVATAEAVQVGDLVAVGSTGAFAGQPGASASAAPVAVAGASVLGGTNGTNQSGAGSFFDTGATPIGRVVLAPWSTQVGADQASSSSALAAAGINGVGDVSVAPSSSLATWTPGMSNSAAVSDGAVIHLGTTTIRVLHAESDSSGFGRTYLVQINNMVIGNTDANGCLIDLGSVAAVGCLKVIGGTEATATVLQAVIGSSAPLGKVVAASATGGAGKTSSGPASVLSADTTRAGAGSLLARTGLDVIELAALAMLLLTAGAIAIHTSGHKLQLIPGNTHR